MMTPNEQKAVELMNSGVGMRPALELMAEWKDEQQKALIERACALYNLNLKNFCKLLRKIGKVYDIDHLENLIDTEKHVNQFRSLLNGLKS